MSDGIPKTTIEFLDALKSLNSRNSDGGTARMLGVKAQTVSNYRAGRSLFDDDMCFRVAKALGIKREYVVACIHAERAKSDEARTVWEHIAATFARAAMFVFALGILALNTPV